jgi:hypothetical protein
MQQFHSIITSIAKRQEHVWDIAKAHSRGFVKIAELTIVTSGGESRRIRRQTIEIDHLRNRIEPLVHYVEKLDKLTDFLEIHKVHEEIITLLDLYRREIHDLGLILHEADILIRRSESLFRHIEKEAAVLGLKHVSSLVQSYSKVLKNVLSKLESLARREFLDINGMLKKLPAPPELKQVKQQAA